MTTVIYHSADYDGIFCREIARKFLSEAELVGWDFQDPPMPVPSEGEIYVMDLPVDRVFGRTFGEEGHLRWLERVTWIDHHKTSIETHNPTIPGYRIDGVAACRLAWQWFSAKAAIPTNGEKYLPEKREFVERMVPEPLAVRLAGEYDIWDKRDPRAERFQHGLRSADLEADDWWPHLLSLGPDGEGAVEELLFRGEAVQFAQERADASVARLRSFELRWEGLTFLALNTARCNSLSFAAGIKPEHEALLGFYFNGKVWTVSLYGAPGRPEVDLSVIAVKHGGGGHKQACGFTTRFLPWSVWKAETAPQKETPPENP